MNEWLPFRHKKIKFEIIINLHYLKGNIIRRTRNVLALFKEVLITSATLNAEKLIFEYRHESIASTLCVIIKDDEKFNTDNNTFVDFKYFVWTNSIG